MVCKELQNLDKEIHHNFQSTTLNDNVDENESTDDIADDTKENSD